MTSSISANIFPHDPAYRTFRSAQIVCISPTVELYDHPNHFQFLNIWGRGLSGRVFSKMAATKQKEFIQVYKRRLVRQSVSMRAECGLRFKALLHFTAGGN